MTKLFSHTLVTRPTATMACGLFAQSPPTSSPQPTRPPPPPTDRAPKKSAPAPTQPAPQPVETAPPPDKAPEAPKWQIDWQTVTPGQRVPLDSVPVLLK